MKIDFQSGFNALLHFCSEHTKELVQIVKGLPIIGSLMKGQLFESKPDDKKVFERKVESACVQKQPVKVEYKSIDAFPTEDVSDGDYPGLKVGSIVAYKGAFGVEALEHYGVYLGEGRVMQFTGGAEPGSLTGKVEVTLLSKFTEQTKKNIIIRNHKKLRLEDEDSIRKRAEDELNKPQESQIYNPERNNCQHLANRVSFGGNYSTQVDEITHTINKKVGGFVSKQASQFMTEKGIKSWSVTKVGGDVFGLLAGYAVTGAISFLSDKISTALYERSCSPVVA